MVAVVIKFSLDLNKSDLSKSDFEHQSVHQAILKIYDKNKQFLRSKKSCLLNIIFCLLSFRPKGGC